MLMGCFVVGNIAGCDISRPSMEKGNVNGQKTEAPTSIVIWNYYNGDQQAAFDNLVSEFNDTIGTEQGIFVSAVSQGSIENLADSLIDAANGKIGAQELPSMASIYAETAYILEQQELLVNLDEYFTREELDVYIPTFLDEGRLVNAGELLLFPISKSTECFSVNITDWKAFEEATGIAADSIDSYEGLAETAEQYYNWTDSLTPDVPEDGQALYGRDSIANYIYIGAAQLGHELFTVDAGGMNMNLDKETFRKLWDCYYIPFINGYFAADSNHRSEDMKTGRVLAMTGSTSGVSYLPTSVVDENDISHDIEIQISKPLTFKGGKEIVVQQGAGYCVLKGTEQEQHASAEFLKWFTASDRNLQFSVSSGYSPVTYAANQEEQIKANFTDTQDSMKHHNMLNALLISADIYMNSEIYTNKPFHGSKEVRDILEESLSSIAEKDRASVLSAMEMGATRQEATELFCSDGYFDAWYAHLCAEIEKATVGM